MTVRIFVFLLVLGMGAPVAAGQQDAGKDLKELNLEQLMNVQFYTASKRAQHASDTPASVTVVTADEIRTFGYRTLADVLQGVPGFWVNNDRMYSYLGVRGLVRPGDYNMRILLLVNGHRLNDEIDGMALLGTEFPLDVDLIEHIEIARGASSSLYGTNAFFAVINIFTRQPPLATRVEVSAEAAAPFGRKARLTVGLPQFLNGALFSGSFYRSDGNASLYYPEYDSPQSNYGFANGVDGDRYANGLATLKWKRFTLQALVGTRRKAVPTGAYGGVLNDPRNQTNDTRGFVDLSYRRDFASGMQVTWRWFYDMCHLNAKVAYELADTRFLGAIIFRGDWVGSEFTLSRPLGQRNILTSGVEFRYDPRQIIKSSAFAFPQQLMDARHHGSVFAIYGQDELTLTSRLALNFGLRLDSYSTFGWAASPRFAAIFHPAPKTTLKYIFGRAFRAPSAAEMYYADGLTYETNPSLKPETILSHNLAVERALTPELSVSGEGFLNQMHSLIDTEVDLATGRLHFVNAHSYTSKGIQLGIQAQRRAWKAALSYTLQKTEDPSTGQRLANSPLHLTKLRLQAPLGSPLLAGFAWRFQSPQWTYAGNRIPSLLNADLTISSRKAILGFDVSASIYNLFDRHNYDPVPPWLRQLRMPLDGREFRIKITRLIPRD